MYTEEIKKCESDEEDEEEIRDIVGDSIRKCANYENSKNKLYQIDKIISVNFNHEPNQFKQIEKILNDTSYKSGKPKSQLKSLKKNSQKQFTIFWHNPMMNSDLTFTQYHCCQATISDIILETIQQINQQIQRYQLITDYTLYCLTKAQENGEQFSEPLLYTTKIKSINCQFFRLDPKNNNFINSPQIDGKYVFPQRKSGYINIESTASTGSCINVEKINQDNNSIIECYSKGICQLLEIEQLTENCSNEESSENVTNNQQQQNLQTNFQDLCSSKLIKNRQIDQVPCQVSSCNFFSFIKCFGNKKQK